MATIVTSKAEIPQPQTQQIHNTRPVIKYMHVHKHFNMHTRQELLSTDWRHTEDTLEQP